MFFRKQNWNIVGKFALISAISYAVIIAGAIALFAHHGLRLGLSFTGGTDVTVKFAKPVTPAQLQAALAPAGVADARINTISKSGDLGGDRYTIETQKAFGNDTAPLWKALGSVAQVDRGQSEIESVGPSLSQEYLWNAIKALLIAITIQFVYIAFRFGWNYIFGVVVVIALIRDSAMMIGIYALADRRADDAFLAAVLTVIGYSVMDTIVILDRIRENTKLMAGETYEKIVNRSILDTMTRSLNTLATVVITLVALIALGGLSLQNFAFALLVGICSGGYHSIFYSAPLVVRLQKWHQKRMGAAQDSFPGSAADRPKTVAEARAQAARMAERESIVAARRDRRSKSKASAPRAAGPARYKRRRDEGTAFTAGGAVQSLDEMREEEVLDPLDAQLSGRHDEEYALGHEEIRLNLGDEDVEINEHAHVNDAAPRSTPER